MRNGHTSDEFSLVVQDEDNLSRLAVVLDWGFYEEENSPEKEHEVQEGTELDCTAVAYALGIFAGPES